MGADQGPSQGPRGAAATAPRRGLHGLTGLQRLGPPEPGAPGSARTDAALGWGRGVRQAWQLAAPFWRDRGERTAWAQLAAVVALTLASVALNVRFSTWNADFYNALQAHDMPAFWRQIGVFAGLAGVAIVAAVYRLALLQRLTMRWRHWTTRWLLGDWLQPGAAYRLSLQAARPAAAGDAAGEAEGVVGVAAATTPHVPPPGLAGALDNPDQRLAEDVRSFVATTLELSLGLLKAALTLVSFVGILWVLSGTLTVPWPGAGWQLPGFMVWVALAYALGGSWLAHRIGRPLIATNAQQQRVEADFRYQLVQVRDHAEAIALARGEGAEQRRLARGFAAIRGNWELLIRYTKRLTWFSAGYGQLANVFPVLAAAPRYFAGAIQLGGLMQTAQAFGQVQDALSWFVDGYAGLADWRATVLRLAHFRETLSAERTRQRLVGAAVVGPSAAGPAGLAPASASAPLGTASAAPAAASTKVMATVPGMATATANAAAATAAGAGVGVGAAAAATAPVDGEHGLPSLHDAGARAPAARLLVHGLTVRPPGGSALLHVPHLALAQGERLLVTGRSGSGKSGLVRTLAGLWPGRPGSLEVPAGTLFIGQRPYLPDGPLAEVLVYPLEPGAIESERLVEALGLAGLTRLAPLLGESRAWSRRLSPGEQQRLQFARIFLMRPRWVVLDEASSALDDAAERRLHETLRTLLLDTAVLSVGHHAALRRWHERELQVQGGELRAPRGEPLDAQGGVAPAPAWRRDGPSGSAPDADAPSAGSAPRPRTGSPRRVA